MRMHVRALFTVDCAGQLLRVNEPDGGPAPRFFIGWTYEGNLCRFRNDLDPSLIAGLNALCQAQPIGRDTEPGPDQVEPFIICLSRYAPVARIWTGPAYHFPARLPDAGAAIRLTPDTADVLSPWLESWSGDVRSGVPMTAVLENGKAVSVCSSVRITREAHEAGVETHPSFRGRGHAVAAVRAWARIVREMGCAPLYSTSWQNRASLAVARKLGLIQFGNDLHLT
jgi:RimJ/RimL family protein N-acetyltransferase